MEILALHGRLHDALPDHEVAEPLALVALKGVLLDQRLEDAEDFFFGDGGAVELVEAVAVVAAA